jgi:hypothetical protein
MAGTEKQDINAFSKGFSASFKSQVMMFPENDE